MNDCREYNHMCYNHNTKFDSLVSINQAQYGKQNQTTRTNVH